MTAYVIAIKNSQTTHNTDASHYKWLKTKQIHFDQAKGQNRELVIDTCLLYQLRHAVMFLDYVQNEVKHLPWVIAAVEPIINENRPEVIYFDDLEMAAVPTDEVDRIRKLISESCVT